MMAQSWAESNSDMTNYGRFINQFLPGFELVDTATRVQILDENDCNSHTTNTRGEGMNPIILPPAMGK